MNWKTLKNTRSNFWLKKNDAYLDDRLLRPEEIWPFPSSVSDRKPPWWFIGLLIIIVFGLWIILKLSAPSAAHGHVRATKPDTASAETTSYVGGVDKASDPCELEDVVCKKEILYTEIKTVTAYNFVRGQTDDKPCLSADSTDVCKLEKRGERSCAADYPFGTRLFVPGFGECVVHDRTARKYRKRIDLGFPKEKLREARRWGKKNVLILVLK